MSVQYEMYYDVMLLFLLQEIPGLEKMELSWMRKLINAYEGIA